MRLVKLHGHGNDFLVCDPGRPLDEAHRIELARRWCDRHRGFGADGLMFVVAAEPASLDRDDNIGLGEAEVAMQLHNADGSVAELSGNGIRCFAHAISRWRGEDRIDLAIATGSGVRRVVVEPGPVPTVVAAAVSMGTVTSGPELPPSLEQVGVWRATADIGNPHLVVEIAGRSDLTASEVGPVWESAFSEGINVHLVRRLERPDHLSMEIWERGVGLTEACGTGATVVAELFGRRGLVGDRVQVEMPGGTVAVERSEGELTLIGPSELIGDLEPAMGLERGF